MTFLRHLPLIAMLTAAAFAPVAAAQTTAPATAPADSCLMFGATNLAQGDGNFYIYCTFATTRLKIAAGDVLEYDIQLNPANPMARGGIDIDPDSGKSLRDQRTVDQNQLRAHGDADLGQRATGQWYHRQIPLDSLVGKTTRRWNLVFEADQNGRYVQFIDNVIVRHADGSTVAIYQNGKPAVIDLHSKEGYSQHVLLTAVPREQVADAAAIETLIKAHTEQSARREKLAELRDDVKLIGAVAKKSGDAHLAGHADEAAGAIAKLEANESITEEQFQAVLHQVNGAIAHEHPEMRKYTGHLVGHAHIDFQWLWEWPETVDVCRQTFTQAVKFMAEFPQFKFSQSSTALYATTEQHFPELFKEIQKFVASGQWELVGGRVCEGDEHMISHESHARQFLYGQRYFRERFDGRSAIVGWEPDTFGHTRQMPQILQLGGCKYFYFCRGGRKNPMFWWEAPDGTRVLAFEEPATGGWYNGDVTRKRFDQLMAFDDKLGFKDMLWVYGVGNHGGGPTRENILAALDWMKKPHVPNVRFSTATEFFTSLEKNYDVSKLPVIKDDLNTRDHSGFYGTYTSHSDIKRWNRDAEAATESAEAVAAFAAQFGFAYPRAEFRRNWEDICWNHHHDTLPGTSIHASYNLSETMYKRVIESSHQIAADAMAHLASRLTGPQSGAVAFNPSGWTRTSVVNGTEPSIASEMPAYSLRRVASLGAVPAVNVAVENDAAVLESADYKLIVDGTRGVVTSVVEKSTRREYIAPGGSGNRMEIHWEDPVGMSAWNIGKIQKVEPLLTPVKLDVTESGGQRVTVQWQRVFQETTIVQTVSLPAKGPPEFSLATEWKELGNDSHPNPFLKVAFDVNTESEKPTATYQVPFGTIEKPSDNQEYPALKFVDLADAAGGAALINDCKHGYSSEGRTVRLSLIRTTYDPDKTPNTRPQSARWAFLPHSKGWKDARVIEAAEAFNHPLLSASATTKAGNDVPADTSLLSVDATNVVITGVKLAEDDNSLIVRLYESHGRATETKLRTLWKVPHAHVVNFIEDEIDHAKVDPAGDVEVELRPYEIKTFSLPLGTRR